MTFDLRKLFGWTTVFACAFYLGFYGPLRADDQAGRFGTTLLLLLIYFGGFWYLRTIRALWPRNQKELIKEVVARCRQERSKHRR
jgi:hypothetical protein